MPYQFYARACVCPHLPFTLHNSICYLSIEKEKGRKIEMSTSATISQETQVGPVSSRATFLESMADKIGINARVSAVFADPVERDGVTIIPVAKARWGFGGGAGSGAASSQTHVGEGSGGGAGVMLSPVGYIELKDGKARYRPIYDIGTFLRLFIVVGIVTPLVLRSVRRLIRSL